MGKLKHYNGSRIHFCIDWDNVFWHKIKVFLAQVFYVFLLNPKIDLLSLKLTTSTTTANTEMTTATTTMKTTTTTTLRTTKAMTTTTTTTASVKPIFW